MGLFSFFSGPQTKSDWDQEIIRLQNDLAGAQAELARRQSYNVKNYPTKSALIAESKGRIAKIKGDIANAKTQRKSAPAK